MQANELRIGNWVIQGQYGTARCTAYEIYKFSSLQAGSNEAEYYRHWAPIQLTPEILEKAGFVEDRWTRTKQTKTFRIDVYPDYSMILFRKGDDLGANIIPLSHAVKYVHQLQNLYFALTGEELKIEL